MLSSLLKLFVVCGALGATSSSTIQNIDIGRAHGNYVGKVTLYWRVCRRHADAADLDVLMAMRQRVARGYMGVATRTHTLQGAHQDTDLILAWFDRAGAPHVADLFSQSVLSGCAEYGTCSRLDSSMPGGSDDVSLVCGWQHRVAGSLVAWRRAANTGDRFDATWPGRPIELMWAATNASIERWEDVNSIAHMHCAECSSPLYQQCTRQCPLQGETGYMERDRALPIRLYNKDDNHATCDEATKEFQSLLCAPSATLETQSAVDDDLVSS